MLPALTAIAMLLSTTPAINPVSLTNATASKSTVASTAATATVIFNTNGSVTDQDAATLETWLLSGYSSADYQIRADLSSGTAPTSGDSTGVWLSLSSSRSWSLTEAAAAIGTSTSVLTVQIRDAASPNTVRATANFTLSANSADRTADVQPGNYTGDGNGTDGTLGFGKITFNSDGNAYWEIGQDLPDSGSYTWRTGDSDSAGYEVRATLVSGTTPTSGTMNTWLPLSTSRQWQNTKNSTGTKTSTITFEIRNASAPNNVLDSASVTIAGNWFA